MRGFNKVILIGRLGKDPELRESKLGGVRWGSFSLATNRGVRRGEQWEEETDWHRVTCFGALAEQCGEYISKGSLVAVEGSVQHSHWTNEAGERRYSTTIIAEEVTFLDAANTKNIAPDLLEA